MVLFIPCPGGGLDSNIPLSQMDGIYLMLWGLLFSAFMVQGGESCVGLGPLPPQWELPQLKYPSQLSTATHGYGINLFYVSTSPTS